MFICGFSGKATPSALRSRLGLTDEVGRLLNVLVGAV